jgi:HAD superfamily hydrolase (TIGR01484 family)
MPKTLLSPKKAKSADIRLISLDFDGTILVYDDPAGVFHPEVISILNLLEEKDIQWCANSGRDYADQLGVIERSRERGLTHLPVALICSESLVYVQNSDGYHELAPWNAQAHDALRVCHSLVQARLGNRLEYIEKKYQPITTMVGELYTAFFIRDHEGMPVALFHELNRFLDGIDEAMLTRNGGWVAVMHRALGKGHALNAYAAHAGLASDHILCVGDQYNDLPMLNRDVARFLGCPGDAIPEVRHAVGKAGGIIAEAPGPLGTLEVIRTLLDVDDE